MCSPSTVVCGRVRSVHTGELEEHPVVGAVLGDGEPALQGRVVALAIIPPNVCQPLQTLPWRLTDPAHTHMSSAQ